MRSAVFAFVSLVSSVAYADTRADVAPPVPTEIPTARPVVPIDDTRSYGPTARNFFDVGVTSALLFADNTTTLQLTGQFVVGLPFAKVRELRELYETYNLDAYLLRVRYDLFAGDETSNGGPMTFALQRYFSVSRLAIGQLAFAHAGVEAALATPWFSGRDVTPIRAIQILDGPDTELSDSGWSIRPFSTYFRADFLACRSESLELGLAPEAFVPIGRVNEYGTRFHIAAGFSLGCHGNMSPYAPKITLEYRGRVRMYAGDQGVDYRDNIAAGVQFDFGPLVVQAFYKADPGRLGTAAAFGVRLQAGMENKR